jgi:hypothetical protein
LLVAFLGASWGAWAVGTGNELISRCGASVANLDGRRDVDVYDMAYCVGMVKGVSDELILNGWACMPSEVTIGQQIRVVHKYLQEHPTELQEIDTVLTHRALVRAWPCNRKP